MKLKGKQRIKIFKHFNKQNLETEVNEWLKDNDALDLTYSCELQNIESIYTVMAVYYEDETNKK